MESLKASDETKNDKVPKERRIRTKQTEGNLDENGFFRTPNDSFWDMDGEYFNHHGFDIHGGKYVNVLDYIPGPTWIEELGCYPEDEEKYKNEDINDIADDNDNDNELDILEAENEINIQNIGKLDINAEDKKDEFLNEIKDKKNKKGKNNKKKKKEESYDEDEWEEIED